MTILLTILLIISSITSIYYFRTHLAHHHFWLPLTFLIIAIISLGAINTLANSASASKIQNQHISKKEGHRAKQEALANSSALKKQLAAKKSEASSLSIAVSEQAAATKVNEQASTTVDTPQATTNQAVKMVTVAPSAGKKYHLDANCRGLKRANSTTTMTLSEAQAQGYTLCGWED